MTFAEVLNEILIENNMTKRRLAGICHVTTSQMTSFFRGAMPSIKTATRIADILDISLNFLMGLDENREETKVLNKGYDLSNFLNRYQTALELNKISHWKASRLLSISESNIRGWRKGSIPKIETLMKLAEYLHVSIDYLLGRARD